MYKIVLLIFIVFLNSCALLKRDNSSSHSDPAKVTSNAAKEVSYLENYQPIVKDIIRGESHFVEVLIPRMENGHLKCNNREIKTFYRSQAYVGFVAAAYFDSRTTQINCFWMLDKKDYLVSTFNIQDKKYPSERIRVDKKRVFLSKKDQAIVDKERVFKNKIYASSPNIPYFEFPFQLPIQSIKTSEYGTQRVYNGKKKSSHLGVDYRAAVGEKIWASNTGKVVIARDLFYTGYTVVIDHGLDIFSIYAHLSKLMVSEGDRVPQGTLIGLAGATGRVTGPHLHWGVSLNGQAINGESLVENSQFLSEK